MKYYIFLLSLLVMAAIGCKKKPSCDIRILSPKSNAVYHLGDSIPIIFSFSDCDADSQCLEIQRNYVQNYYLDTVLYRSEYYVGPNGVYFIRLGLPASVNSTDTLLIVYTICSEIESYQFGVPVYIEP